MEEHWGEKSVTDEGENNNTMLPKVANFPLNLSISLFTFHHKE